MRKVVLTGATSMLGVALINECIKNGVEVVALFHPNSANLERIPKSGLVRLVECGLSDLEKMDETALGADNDVFFHFGWSDTSKEQRVKAYPQYTNIGFTLDAVRLAQRIGCKKFIGAGSQAEYGRVMNVISPKTPVNPDSAYGIAKYAAGRLSAIECASLGIEHIWTRIFSVYGIWDNEATMISAVTQSLLHGEVPKLTKGEQLWDYLYSEDAGRAFYLLGEKGKDCSLYNIGSGKAHPIKEYVEMMCAAVGSGAKAQIGALEYSPMQVMHLCADIDRLVEDTGFRPQISFEEGIARTIDWMRGRAQ